MSTETITFENTDVLSDHEIVSREEWLIARKDLLEREKEFTRLRDQLAAERRALPWVKIDKEYIFDAPEGEVTLAELFDERSQLFIKHFMMAPGQKTQCVGCSLEVDHIDGILPHLENHDVSYVAVARAPIEEIEAVRKRMGWKFRWVSSYRSDFNYDFNVSWTREQIDSGRALYNYWRSAGMGGRHRRLVWQQRVLQRRVRSDLSHLFNVRSRRRRISRHLQVPRHDAERAQRKWSLPQPPRLGAATEHVRERRRGRS